MKADYGTYSHKWLTFSPFAAAAVLGGLALLPMPPWARVILGMLVALLAFAGIYMIYMTRAFSDDELKKAVQNVVLARLPWDGRGRVLDIGTGSGLLATGLALKFPDAKVVGCDTWAGGFMGLTRSLCERNAVAEGVADRVHFEEGNACHLPYADEEFDAVVSKDVFHAVQEQKDKLALFREALRVLRPGGAFAFEDPFGIKLIYRDLDGLIATLRADGLASLEFVWLDDVVHVSPLLRPIVGRPGILYGVK